MDNSNRTIVSRRSRPAKEPLSREIIVKTALELLKQEGADGLSMRRIAKALDTGASSLYVYVTNVQELSAYVLDYSLAQVQLPDPSAGSWSDNLFEALFSYVQVLHETPGIASLAMSTMPNGPHSLALTEYVLGRLHEGGIRSAAAAWGADMVLLYASSVAFEQASRDQQGTTLQSLTASYEKLDPRQYPMLTAMRDEFLTGGHPDNGKVRFRWGFDVIVQGLLKQTT
ncbi:TetR family transcriptional regulator [Paenibacillus cellulosilyticus]|uniref:TetR family transcriptional regulator n=1 Tax=Paenibacillus cellulosilyticus TaxID=375489 RepID=A0A2V2YRB5_9BACL|nr:TetR/AcrR family transcriptional regulator [Paenibacillus cellulosilyticus]PWV99770.1 TetR family transcriptional regulator [Paenibacillus cellulosilyticus]QKS44809.1 TetR/AcrR family transcriptional regulator [Paenibacillus cellulosilyticus]